MPRGGKRENAGRPEGRRDKRTVLMDLLPKLDESDRQLPLYRLLARAGARPEIEFMRLSSYRLAKESSVRCSSSAMPRPALSGGRYCRR
jgi:hypothetical protein